MRHYETLFILNPEISDEDTDAAVEKYTGILTEGGAFIGIVDKWGRRRLAYTVKKFNKGFYILLDYGALPEAVAEMERLFKIDEQVIRFLTVKQGEHYDMEAAKAALEAKAAKKAQAESDAAQRAEAQKAEAEKAEAQKAEAEKAEAQKAEAQEAAPEEAAPEATEPEATEPEATEPEAAEPEAAEPEVTEPEATEPEAPAETEAPAEEQGGDDADSKQQEKQD